MSRKLCAPCGVTTDASESYCRRCFALLPTSAAPTNCANNCSGCGAPNLLKFRVCSTCGLRRDGPASVVICWICSAENSEGYSSCASCGEGPLLEAPDAEKEESSGEEASKSLLEPPAPLDDSAEAVVVVEAFESSESDGDKPADRPASPPPLPPRTRASVTTAATEEQAPSLSVDSNASPPPIPSRAQRDRPRSVPKAAAINAKPAATLLVDSREQLVSKHEALLNAYVRECVAARTSSAVVVVADGNAKKASEEEKSVLVSRVGGEGGLVGALCGEGWRAAVDQLIGSASSGFFF